MKIAAIITEYNPFHKGHAYQIEMTKSSLNADYVIVIMSGMFTQRGIPAIYDKYTRASMALLGGADLVIELPTAYATASAEFFSMGGVYITDNLGVVDTLVFGSECDDINKLKEIATILADEPASFSATLKNNLESGLSFPKARELALIDELGIDILDIITKPNNILGIEYIKALYKAKSSIQPVSIKRNTSSHNSLSINETFSSSAAVRNALIDLSGQCMLDIFPISKALPEYSANLILDLFNSGICPLFRNDFSQFLHYKLLDSSRVGFCDYFDVSKELSDKIINKLSGFSDYDSFVDLLKTKEITHSRISRALLHILLNIKITDLSRPEYATLLGFKKESSEVLNLIKKNSSIPLISKNANYSSILSDNPNAIKMFETDIFAYDIYESALMHKCGTHKKNLMQQSPVIL